MKEITHIHGGNIEQAKKKYNLKEGEIIDFSANINFLGPPPSVLKVIKEKVAKITQYPEPNSRQLQQKLAEWLDLPPGRLVVGNGAAALIYQLATIIQPGAALVIAPSFSEYEMAVRSVEGSINYLQLREDSHFQLSIESIIDAFTGIDMAFICNPHNPTGTLYRREEIIKLVTAARERDVLLVVDEAFIDFVADYEQYTVKDLSGEYSNLVVFRSLTKFFALPGLRLGFALGPEQLITELESRRDPWTVNILAQMAGEAALRDNAYINKTRKINQQERKFLYRELQGIKGLKPFQPAANFIFIKIEPENFTAGKLIDLLGERGILIRDCSSYQGLNNKYIRVAVKARSDNKKLLTALRKLFVS